MPVTANGYSNPRVQYYLNKRILMIPIPLCAQIIVAVSAIVAGKELLKDKD